MGPADNYRCHLPQWQPVDKPAQSKRSVNDAIADDMITGMSDVRRLRLRAGLTQDELAERSGVAQPNIAAYESGTRAASAAMLGRLRAVAPPRPSEVLSENREEVLELARGHRATDVRVFGSISRHEDVSGSDIDLLVRFTSDADVFDLADLSLALQELTGLHVDVVSERGLRPGPNPIRDEAIPL